eukprot:225239_1
MRMETDYEEALFAWNCVFCPRSSLVPPITLSKVMSIVVPVIFMCYYLSVRIVFLVVPFSSCHPFIPLLISGAICFGTFIIGPLLGFSIICRHNFIFFVIKLIILGIISDTKYVIEVYCLPVWRGIDMNRVSLIHTAHRINVEYTRIKNECVICKDGLHGVYHNAYLLPCGHHFHKSCLDQWEALQRTPNKCSVCRAKYLKRHKFDYGQVLQVINAIGLSW